MFPLLKILIFSLLFLLPAVQLLRDWKYSDKRTRRYRLINRVILGAMILLAVPSTIFQWAADRAVSEDRKHQAELLEKANEQIQAQRELRVKAEQQADAQRELKLKSDEIAKLYKSLASKSEQNNSLSRSIELILHPQESKEDVTVELIIDRGRSKIYPASPIMYLIGTGITDDHDTQKLVLDKALVGILNFIGWNENDWQMEKTLVSESIGVATIWRRKSKQNECSVYTKEQIRNELSRNDNAFVKDLQIPVSLCLPPHSEFKIQRDTSSKDHPVYSVSIKGPICALSIMIDEFGVLNTTPGASEYPVTPEGKPVYETHTVLISVRSLINASGESSHRYYEWVDRFKDSFRMYFRPQDKRA